jgi:DNA invertase Pin-like site-specific DNA recombinase
MGHVGLVLGIEMSRLARSGADWYQLLELCALSGALLADADGIYDPVGYNDRLLLGLKETMSEAELHLLKQRMLAGKQAKARRGELAIALPTGYVRRPSGEAALDPDEQARAVVRLIFAKFAELGTLHAVLRWLVDHGVELGMRLRCGPDRGELVWRRPNRMTLQNILHSPVYAGIYADGRRRVDPTGSCRAGPAPAGWSVTPTSGWWRSRGAARLRHRRAVPRQPGPAGGQRRPRRDPAWCAPGQRCCRGRRGAAVAAGA